MSRVREAVSALRTLIGLVAVVIVLLAIDGAQANQVLADEPEEVVGEVGEPVPSIPSGESPPNSVAIVPASPTFVGNCIPFANNTSFGFTGFIYRNVPAFGMVSGDEFSFDLGALNSSDIRRNIYFAAANINPAPAGGFNVVSQGVMATGWTQVASDTQIPLNPKGNTVSGDYELTYTAEAPFNFAGGGFIVGFGGSPPGAYADSGCEQVLVQTNSNDVSGQFYARFFYRADQTLGVLDGGTGGTGVALGGIVIHASDTDGDGILDVDDACPNLFGVPEENGCPPPGPPAVGGVAGLLDADARDHTVADSGGGNLGYVAALAGCVGVMLLAAGWYARRRWLT